MSPRYQDCENSIARPDYLHPTLKPILEDGAIAKINQNIKYDQLVLVSHGIHLAGVVGDSMLAHYLLHSGERSHGLDELTRKYLKHENISITELIGKGKNQKRMDEVPTEKVCAYAAEDADVTLKLRNILYQELVKDKLLPLAQKVEFPLIEVLVEMESNGVMIDTAALSVISEKIKVAVAELRTNIFKESLVEFNIDSPKQVGDILFEKMMLPFAMSKLVMPLS